MDREEAVKYAEENFGYEENNEYCVVVRLRHSAVLLPEYGIDGSDRDSNEWAYLDMSGKIDTGMYGSVYYF